MGATRNQDSTHNVGERISWTNRPPISVRPEVMDAKMGLESANLKWNTRRENMQDVCEACHTVEYVGNFYIQYDSMIELYNEKFAKPGKALYGTAKPLLKKAKFSNKLDWIWFELWHHEGRRARMATSMMAPDYTHWHGMYEVAENFYHEFLPELMRLAEKNGKKPVFDEAVNAILAKPEHEWYRNNGGAR